MGKAERVELSAGSQTCEALGEVGRERSQEDNETEAQVSTKLSRV